MPAETLIDALTRAKVAVVAAHPDDEVIGAGILMRRIKALTLVHVTNGAPGGGADAAANGFRELREYAAARRRELDEALAVGGIHARCIEVGCPDQEASLRIAWLARRLKEILGATDLVITHPYEGGHPDHDAAACAVWCACRMIGGEGPGQVEMTSYHNSPTGIETGVFLGGAGEKLEFSPQDRELKRGMLACFKTQAETLKYFGVDEERFRRAPVYDFSRPPHGGKLFYEQFDWGMRGDRFVELAGKALGELGLGGMR